MKNGTEQKQSRLISFDSDEALKNVNIDPLKNTINNELKNSWIPTDSLKRKKNVDQVAEEVKDSAKMVSATRKKRDFAGLPIADYLEFQKKHPKITMDTALDSLQKEKTFFNRFLYNRAKVINSLIDEGESQQKFISQLLSYGSVALFVFLPFFTLFLKLFYFRRKYTYVDHLVFVFHTQTVFFMLLSIYFLTELFGATPQLWVFAVLFLIYFLIAMRKFYQQGYLKTFIKFILINFTYILISLFGIVIVALFSFALF